LAQSRQAPEMQEREQAEGMQFALAVKVKLVAHEQGLDREFRPPAEHIGEIRQPLLDERARPLGSTEAKPE
jgi:hypothetical protein